MEKREIKEPEISRETQIRMMQFFMETSAPRILEEREKEEEAKGK